MTDLSRTSLVFSYLGQQLLQGNIEVAKFLYGNTWTELPPLIRTISELQGHLTAPEVVKDHGELYGTEFLYYWGMTCLGEQSPLVTRDLGTAEACFKKIKSSVPLAEARLAYIELLQSTEPAKSGSNVARLEVLRRWANRQDLFSRIVLAKISFYSFLCEEWSNSSELPTKTLRLLQLPIQRGHPVAIRFWNDVCSCLGNLEATLHPSRIRSDTLYDFKAAATMQMGL